VAFHSRLVTTSLSRPRCSDCPSSAHPHRPESQGFNAEFADFDLTQEHLAEVLCYRLKTEIFKTKDLADEDPVFVPTDVTENLGGAAAKTAGDLGDEDRSV
jgi:hypothetical protein